MSCEQCLEMLDPWVDGDLAPTEIEEMVSHLANCVSCARDEVEVRDLLAKADALPQVVEPQRDLWPDIADQLPTGKSSSGSRPGWASASWRWVAAASLLLFLGGASGWLLREQRPVPPDSARDLVVDRSYGTVSKLGDLPMSLLVFEKSLAELRAQALEEMKASGESSEELEVVERNLDVMDAALLEIRQALEREPKSLLLYQQWATVLKHQADLLQWAGKLARGA